jgi:beta-barrel assembly-enhancing protease
MRARNLFVAMFTVLVLLLTGTSCNKETGKVNIFTLQDDINLGNQLAEEIANDPVNFPILSRTMYPGAYARLDSIVGAFLGTGQVAHSNTFPWTAYIIHNDSLINAFATPGGHIYFYTGLIKALDNEAMFAGVVAHEMAHCALRHGTDQLTRHYGLSMLLSVVLGEDPSMLAQIAADIGSGLAALAYSRKMEYEADDFAVKYMSHTDYHPLALADFFTKLEGMPQPPKFLSTHPSPEDRMEKIEEAWIKHGSKVGGYFEARYQAFQAMLP